MAYPNVKRKNGPSFDFYQKVEVDWVQFGDDDGYTLSDGYGPDVIIPFSSQTIMFLNEETSSTKIVEYSFNGTTVHGELNPSLPTRGMVFDNRPISLIWFRVKSGSTGPCTIRIDSWGVR